VVSTRVSRGREGGANPKQGAGHSVVPHSVCCTAFHDAAGAVGGAERGGHPQAPPCPAREAGGRDGSGGVNRLMHRVDRAAAGTGGGVLIECGKGEVSGSTPQSVSAKPKLSSVHMQKATPGRPQVCILGKARGPKSTMVGSHLRYPYRRGTCIDQHGPN